MVLFIFLADLADCADSFSPKAAKAQLIGHYLSDLIKAKRLKNICAHCG
jgi:hypothetical protein